MDLEADKAIRHHFNSRSRKVSRHANQYIVPVKYDKEGELLTEETVDIRKHLKRLSLTDWRFLECWRRHGWNVEKAVEELAIPQEKVKRLVQHLQIFQQEEIRDKALATIPTPAWIQAKHVENVFDGQLDDSKRDSLKELTKISGGYKSTTQINLQQNFFNKPQLSPEEEKKTREFFDTIAIEAPQENVA